MTLAPALSLREREFLLCRTTKNKNPRDVRDSSFSLREKVRMRVMAFRVAFQKKSRQGARFPSTTTAL